MCNPCQPGIFTGVKPTPSLSYNYVACKHLFPTKFFDAQPFGDRVAAVSGTAACFFMCHGNPLTDVYAD